MNKKIDRKNKELKNKELKNKIKKVPSNIKKIRLSIMLRIALLICLIVLGIISHNNFMKNYYDYIMLLIGIIYCMIPVMYTKRSITFYENGVSYAGRTYTAKKKEDIILFKTNRVADFCRTKMFIQIEDKVLEVTYIKDIQKEYEKAYNKKIY